MSPVEPPKPLEPLEPSRTDRWLPKVTMGLLFLMAIFLPVLVYVLIIWMPITRVYERECLRRGYPKVHVTAFLEPYCEARIDATDVVMPLSHIPLPINGVPVDKSRKDQAP